MWSTPIKAGLLTYNSRVRVASVILSQLFCFGDDHWIVLDEVV